MLLFSFFYCAPASCCDVTCDNFFYPGRGTVEKKRKNGQKGTYSTPSPFLSSSAPFLAPFLFFKAPVLSSCPPSSLSRALCRQHYPLSIPTLPHTDHTLHMTKADQQDEAGSLYDHDRIVLERLGYKQVAASSLSIAISPRYGAFFLEDSFSTSHRYFVCATDQRWPRN